MTKAQSMLGTLITAAIVVAAMPWLWADGAESFRTTWDAVTHGAESVSWLGTVAVWDGGPGLVTTRPALALLPARLAGASVGYAGFLVALALVWAEGSRRLARSFGAVDVAASTAGIFAALAAVGAAAGRTEVLAAGAVLWPVAALIRGARGASLAVAILVLAILSPAGLLLAALILVAGSLARPVGRAPWGAAILAWSLYWLRPEPGWARFLRLAEGQLPVPAVTAPSWLTLSALALLLAAAAAGSKRGRGGLFAGTIVLALLASGAGRAHAFVASLVPGSAAVPLWAVAVASVSPLLLAAAATRPFAMLLGFALLLPGLVSSPEEEPLRPPLELVSAVANDEARVLALPVSLTNDRRWRRALPGNPALVNGLQLLLERNPGLLASELDLREPARLSRWLTRLGVRRVIVPAGDAERLGAVLVRTEGESLVEVSPVSESRAPCLPTSGWRLRASGENPEVSIPERAVDGDPASRWGSGEPQRPGQFFEIDLGQTVALRALELRYRAFHSDFPRGLRVSVREGEGAWALAYSREPYLGAVAWQGDLPYYDRGARGRTRVALGGVNARALRIEQTGRDRRFDWSIAEICVQEESP